VSGSAPNRSTASSVLAERHPSAFVVELIKRQCVSLRELLNNLECTVGLTHVQRRFILKQQRQRVYRRALWRVERGDDVGARALLAVNLLFLSRAERHPAELVRAVTIAQAVELEIRGYERRISIVDTPPDAVEGMRRLHKLANLAGHMHKAEEISSKSQSRRAKKPRPKSKPSRLSETVKAMRTPRAEGKTLDEFIVASAEGSIDGVRICPIRRSGSTMYTIECHADVTDKRDVVFRRTLQEWWTAAGRAKRGLAG
jgi:hypothetical protein